MKTFTDNQGRNWSIVVNVSTVKRVRSMLKIDLLSILVDEGKLIEQLNTDDMLLCDIIYALVKPDADARQVSDEDFGAAMAGDAIGAATAAFLDELADFFPEPKRRLLKRLLATLRSEQEKAADKIEAGLSAIITAPLLIPGDSSGNSPALSASIPAG